jgi:hypothetical protein
MNKEQLQNAVDVLRQHNAVHLEKIRELETGLRKTMDARDEARKGERERYLQCQELAARVDMLEKDRAALIAITGRAIVTSGTR